MTASTPVGSGGRTDPDQLRRKIEDDYAFGESVLPSTVELQTALARRQTELKEAYLTVEQELVTLEREEAILMRALGSVKRELSEFSIPDS